MVNCRPRIANNVVSGFAADRTGHRFSRALRLIEKVKRDRKARLEHFLTHVKCFISSTTDACASPIARSSDSQIIFTAEPSERVRFPQVKEAITTTEIINCGPLIMTGLQRPHWSSLTTMTGTLCKSTFHLWKMTDKWFHMCHDIRNFKITLISA